MNESVGYKAKKELEKLIYEDSGIYRFKQFKKAKSLQTLVSYEEIKVLWDQELKYRPGFFVKDDMVNMPVIFAKINGVPGKKSFSNTYKYWRDVKEFITENSIVYKNGISIASSFFIKLKMAWNGFVKKGKLDVDRFRYSKDFKYYSLSNYLREHLLENIKYIVDNQIFNESISKNVDLDVLAVASSLPKNVIKKLNEFDFTKRNPKIIYITNKDRLLKIAEIIFLVLMHYLGFDILIFAPNGINNIEFALHKNILQIHELGEYREKMMPPIFELIF